MSRSFDPQHPDRAGKSAPHSPGWCGESLHPEDAPGEYAPGPSRDFASTLAGHRFPRRSASNPPPTTLLSPTPQSSANSREHAQPWRAGCTARPRARPAPRAGAGRRLVDLTQRSSRAGRLNSYLEKAAGRARASNSAWAAGGTGRDRSARRGSPGDQERRRRFGARARCVAPPHRVERSPPASCR